MADFIHGKWEMVSAGTFPELWDSYVAEALIAAHPDDQVNKEDVMFKDTKIEIIWSKPDGKWLQHVDIQISLSAGPYSIGVTDNIENCGHGGPLKKVKVGENTLTLDVCIEDGIQGTVECTFEGDKMTAKVTASGSDKVGTAEFKRIENVLTGPFADDFGCRVKCSH